MAHEALGSVGFAWVQREVFATNFYFVCVLVVATGFSCGPGPS